MGNSGMATPPTSSLPTGYSGGPPIEAALPEEVRKRVEMALQDEGDFLKNLLRKGLRKYNPMRSVSWIDDQATEAFQNLYLRALEVRGGYDPSRPVGPWLTGLALMVLKEANPVRRKSAANATDLGEQGQRVLQSAPKKDQEEQLLRLEREERWNLLLANMEKLSAGDRDILRQLVLDEVDTTVVAKNLGISVDQVHMRKCRALKRLRQICQPGAENES